MVQNSLVAHNARFLRDLPLIGTSNELETLIASNPKLDSYYIASTAISDRREWFLKLWNAHKKYADTKFTSQARVDFHGASWEMYLSYLLESRKFDVTSEDSGPDFRINKGAVINIEAVVAKKGSGIYAVPSIKERIVSSVPTEAMLLRVSNALSEKSTKYSKYLSDRMIGVNDINIIALNTGTLEYPQVPIPLVFNVCFGIGNLTMSIPMASDPGEREVYYRHRPALEKGSALVDAEFFLNPANQHISAILHTAIDSLNLKDYGESTLFIVHNPLAKNPLPRNVFSDIAQYEWRGDHCEKIEPGS